MKRLLSALLVLLASVAGAQVVPPGASNAPFMSGTTVPGCTIYSLVYIDSAGQLKCARAPQNGSTTTAGTSTIKWLDTITGASATSNFLNITGAFPATLSAETSGAYFSMTGDNDNSAQNGLRVDFTTASSTQAQNAIKAVLTGSAANSTQSAVYGLFQTTAPTNNVGYGVLGSMGVGGGDPPTYGVGGINSVNAASKFLAGVGGQGTNNNVSTLQVGGYFVSGTGSTATKSFGVIGVAGTDCTGCGGGWFGFGSGANPTLPAMNTNQTLPTTKVALAADNAATTADIFQARDNGTAKITVQDGGSQWVSMGSKNLTLGGGAVNFVQVAVSSNSYQGGMIDYCADASDGTEYQTRCGSVPIALINKGGTETCTVGTPGASSEVVAVSAGTFTVAFTTDTSPTNACNFAANGTSSLTETVMRINFTVRLFGNAATAVTAQ